MSHLKKASISETDRQITWLVVIRSPNAQFNAIIPVCDRVTGLSVITKSVSRLLTTTHNAKPIQSASFGLLPGWKLEHRHTLKADNIVFQFELVGQVTTGSSRPLAKTLDFIEQLLGQDLCK